jgi:hypothetical protein
VRAAAALAQARFAGSWALPAEVVPRSTRRGPRARLVLVRHAPVQLSLWRFQLAFGGAWSPGECAVAWLPRSPRGAALVRRRKRSLAKRRRRQAERARRPQPGQRVFQWRRKCSPFVPRARSIPAGALTRRERQDRAELVFLYRGWDRARPKMRGDCENGPRPCPWVSCRYNLYLDVADNGSLKLNFPDRDPDQMPATGSCVLDVADRVAEGDHLSLEDVGRLMNLGIERVRQLSSLALQAGRVKVMWEERLVAVRVPPGARKP